MQSILRFVALCAVAHTSIAATAAQDDSASAEAVELAPFAVKGDDGPFTETPMVANQSFVTAAELESINAVNIEDTIKYLPNLNIRKRYIGDTNGVTSIRGQNSWMTGRSLVTVDGILLSNFLRTRWDGSPRWAAVSPDEIQYAQIEYGPYSALSSGNALGGSINFVTRMPEGRESSLKATLFSQDFSLYGADDSYNGHKIFGSYGERVGKLSLYAFYNHLENDSHPQSFFTTTALVPATGSEPVAKGAFLDRDSTGRQRITYGDTGPDSLVHDQFKLKARYELAEDIQAQLSLVYWKNDSDKSAPANYLVDANGAPIWSGSYQSYGYRFTVSPSNFVINDRFREDLLAGLTIGGKLAAGWSFDTTLSYFDVIRDETRASSRNPSDPAYTPAGRVTLLDDTNWLTFDARLGTNELGGNERLSLFAGYHFADYSLNLEQSNSSDWRSGSRESIANNTGGQSQTHALYLQTGAKLGEDWRLVAGARQEWWDASGGYLQTATATAHHPARDLAKLSPKLSLEFNPSETWKATLNLAKAYRFPLVPELFQGIVGTDGRVDRNNPDLKPEDAVAMELSLTRNYDGGQTRLTLFRDVVDDAIFNLLNSELRYSLFLNIDEVETKGVELVHDQRSFFFEQLDLRFNASYTDSTIVKNTANPAYEGKVFPRIPKWRVNLFATWRFDQKWSASLGVRHQSHTFNNLDNSDTRGGYGSVSKFLVFDTRLTYRIGDSSSLSLGVDNLFDEEYYAFHPYPQRTYFLDSSFRF